MGWLKIKGKHLKFAASDRCLNPRIADLDSPEKMLAHYEAEAKRRGIRIIPKKGRLGLDWAKMTTTFRWNIRAGTNYESHSTQDKALTLAHEFVHVKQWDKYGGFGIRYLVSARFGWVTEMQAYRESMRAMKALGFTDKELKDFVEGRAARLWKGYALMRRIRRSHFDKYTLKILKKEL